MKRILLLLFSLGALDAGDLEMTVYDQANLPHDTLVTALQQLRLILHRAGITVRVDPGNLSDEEASLFVYAPPPRNAGTACSARPDIALKIVAASPPGVPETVLGVSSPFTRVGINVRLFNDHIREAASRHNRPYAIVLSYAMAHEIGHVLLRNITHDSRGIMSAVWTEQEYSRMHVDGNMYFPEDEAKSMLSDILRTSCRTSDR